MEKNVGSADKGVRVVLGVAIIGVGAYYGSWWGAVGLIPILTAVFGICPGYLPFGVSTCRREQEEKAP